MGTLYLGSQKVCPVITVGGSSLGIPLEVSASGVLQIPTTSFEFIVPNEATSLNFGISGFMNVFKGNTGITKFAFPGLQSITTQSSGFNQVCQQCTNLTTVDFSGLVTINYNNSLTSSFWGCTSLINVDLSNLKTVSGNNSMASTFNGCSNLTSIDLSKVELISGGDVFSNTFQNTAITEMRFTNLQEINNSGSIFTTTVMAYAFKGAPLANLYFNSLKTVQQNNNLVNMLNGVTGCTVHFPSNLQSTIGSWGAVTNGFGGTNTTVLFDLPATS